MLWIKRNLFLAVGGLLALGLLGFGGYYFWTNYQANNAVEEELKQAKAELTRLYGLAPFPSPENITTAKAELQREQNAIRLTQQSFTPLPYARVKGLAFKSLLDTTIDELQKAAAHASVALPQSNGYAFTFTEQQKRLQFSDASFPTIPEQLAEIKAICYVLFDAKINQLTCLRRGRVTADDPPASNDYHELPPNRTNSGAAFSPYVTEFTALSTELAAVLEGFYKSPNGLLVKAIEVKPEDEKPAGAMAPNQPPPPAPAAAPPGTPPPGAPGFRRPPPAPGIPTPGVPPRTRPTGAGPPRTRPGAAVASVAEEGLKTVLDEKMLRITLWVDVLKPPAK